MEPGREVHGRRKDGSEFPLVIGLTPLRSDSGLFVLATIVDLTERTRIDRTKAAGLEGPLEFERYIAELSAKFINVPIEQIVETIREGLGRVCLQLGLDRSGFCTFGPEGEMLQSVTWSAPGVMPIDERLADKDKFPWSLALIHAGEVVHFSSLEDIPNEIDRENFKGIGESVVVLPLSVDGSVKGSVCFGSMQTGHQWSGPALNRLSLIAAVFAQVIARYEREEATRKAAAEAHRLKEELQIENVYLKHEVRERLGSARIVGQSAAVRRVIDQIQQVAPDAVDRAPVGRDRNRERTVRDADPRTGTAPQSLDGSRQLCRDSADVDGKRVVRPRARRVHRRAGASDGRFEMADQSTIFLDEIGDLPLDVQVKLLRVLEEKTIERLGSPQPIRVDVRIIAATHRNLEKRVADGAFREDLYYRLNVFPVAVPPLRDRPDDIPLLVWRFVEEFSKAFGRRIDSIDRRHLRRCLNIPGRATSASFVMSSSGR